MAILAWVDASSGVAGDMLAGALVDAGVPLEVLQSAVDAVMPGLARLSVRSVQRHGLHATKLDVEVLEADAPHRHLAQILDMVDGARLQPEVRSGVRDVFSLLGRAEATAHAVDLQEVHFHEVGAVDSIADIVAVCEGLAWLEVEQLRFGDIALGSGSVKTAHGVLAVPTPAGLQLTKGLRVLAGGSGELATPTGLALLAALGVQGELPRLRVESVGSGAGTKDFADHANVLRIIVGSSDETVHLLLEANVDDMDPRLWPGAIELIMAAGAQDAWLTPIVMKKGRPAHTLSVLCTDRARADIEEVILRETTTIGLRVMEVEKVAQERHFEGVEVDGHAIAVKVAVRHGRIYNVSIEFDDVVRAARALDRPTRDVLRTAGSAAAAQGLVTGAEYSA